MENTYLIHYGVKGMKWGVRKKTDSSEGIRGRTNANSKLKNGLKKAAIAGGVVIAAYATHKIINDPRVLSAGAKAVKTAMSKSSKIASAISGTTEAKLVSTITKKLAAPSKSALQGVLNSMPTVRTAMINAGVAATGAIAAERISNRLADKEGASQNANDVRKIMRESLVTGVNTATNASTVGTSSKRDTLSKEDTDSRRPSTVSEAAAKNVLKNRTQIIGKPSGVRVDRQSKEYSDLFNGVDDPYVRRSIKALAIQGYSTGQIERFINAVDNEVATVRHSLSILLPVYVGNMPVVDLYI